MKTQFFEMCNLYIMWLYAGDQVVLPVYMSLEAEKAALLARATVAEEQLQETQEYIDKHLTRLLNY